MIRFEWQAAWVKHDMYAKGVIEVIRVECKNFIVFNKSRPAPALIE